MSHAVADVSAAVSPDAVWGRSDPSDRSAVLAEILARVSSEALQGETLDAVLVSRDGTGPAGVLLGFADRLEHRRENFAPVLERLDAIAAEHRRPEQEPERAVVVG
jgi:hypothetical protein